MRLLLPGLAFVAVVGAANVWRSSRFEESIRDARAELARVVPSESGARTDLPLEIEAFARRATASAKSGMVVMEQVGEMRLAPDSGWSALTAEHAVSTVEPAFVWRANVEMAPFINAVVVDSYVGGVGRLEARLLGSAGRRLCLLARRSQGRAVPLRERAAAIMAGVYLWF